MAGSETNEDPFIRIKRAEYSLNHMADAAIHAQGPGEWEKKYYELKKWYNGSVKEAQALLEENLALKDRIVEYFLEGK